MRLYPSSSQCVELAKAFGCARAVWNDGLRLRRDAHTRGLPRPTAAELSQRARYGRTFVKVSRWFPSTQLCSHCGALSGPKGREQLSMRTWTCDCGTTHDRDENAEANLRAAGRKLAAGKRREAERQNACEEHVRPRKPGQRSSSQEPTRSPAAYSSGAGGNRPASVG
ncbi:zinc ribbon domain-containing protein [Streptomyces sp. NPDC048595]|uniref:helix-turn-helix domain-containing protein n=1 Tax=Streptomyces sp. NPDC048595 TaxID=3365576 RepID=UPI003721C17B